MDITQALTELKGGENDAMKRPSWKGYMKLSDYVAPDPEASTPVPESFTLALITGASTTPGATETTVTPGADTTNGTADDIGTYVFTYDESDTPKWTMPTAQAKQLVVDPQLMEGIFADDWITGKSADFETARSGGSGRW